MAKIINFVQCPIRKNEINIGLCYDIQNVVDNMITENIYKNDIDFNLSERDRSVCINCIKRTNLEL